jgi:hypothetical protein
MHRLPAMQVVALHTHVPPPEHVPALPPLHDAPVVHAHALPVHAKPGGQACPHAPQLAASDASALQFPAAPGQHVWPDRQCAPLLHEHRSFDGPGRQASPRSQVLLLHTHKPEAAMQLPKLAPGLQPGSVLHPHRFAGRPAPSQTKPLPWLAQFTAHPPQLAASAATFFSHPSSAPAGGRLQLPNPRTQADVQFPPLHAFDNTF